MRLSLLCLRLLCVGPVAALGFLRAAEPAAPAAAPAPFAREQVLAALARDLAAHFNLAGELQLELLREWVPPARTATAWTTEILDFPVAPNASMLVRCRFLADQVPVAEKTLVLHASLWRDAWVARQPLVVGAGFDPVMLESRRVDFFRDRDAVPSDATNERGYVFARALSAGRLLTWHDITRRPLVRRGQLVEVSAIEGMLNISMKGLAMENGAQGDTVTVRNPESRKEFSALVIDENHVQVTF